MDRTVGKDLDEQKLLKTHRSHRVKTGKRVKLGSRNEPNVRSGLNVAIDPRLRQAVDRGAEVRRKLIKSEGGGLSTQAAARQLGISKEALLKRYNQGRLIAWRSGRRRALRFPAWQFHDGRVLPGLEVVLAILNEKHGLDVYGKMLFFLSTSAFLGGSRPLDWLRGGGAFKVAQAAKTYC